MVRHSRTAPGRATLPAALLAVLTLLVAGCGSADPVSPPGPNVGTRTDQQVPAALLHLPLRDQDGRVRHLADYRGDVLVVSDAMTLCQETCPLDTAQLVQTAREVDRAGDGRHVQFLSITVDPRRDTPRQLAAYRRLFHDAPANWTLLTGSAADIHALWKWFGVYWKVVPQHDRPRPRNWRTGAPLTYDVTHSDEVFFLRGGHERFVLEGMPHLASGSEIPARIRRFMSAQGRHNVDHPHAYAWTTGQAAHVVSWLLDRPSGG